MCTGEAGASGRFLWIGDPERADFTDRLRRSGGDSPSGSGIQRADVRCGGSASKPVWWSRNEVQVVILTVVGSEEDPKLEKFYEATTDLILRPGDIRYLVEHPDYDTFLRMLRK